MQFLFYDGIFYKLKHSKTASWKEILSDFAKFDLKLKFFLDNGDSIYRILTVVWDQLD